MQCHRSPQLQFGSCLLMLGRMDCWCRAGWKTLHPLSSLAATKVELGGSYVKQSWRGRCGWFIVLTPDFLPLNQRYCSPKRRLRPDLLLTSRSLQCKFVLILVAGHLGTSMLSYQAMSSSPRAALSNVQPPHTSPWENSNFLPFCNMRNLV